VDDEASLQELLHEPGRDVAGGSGDAHPAHHLSSLVVGLLYSS
jgi:hypothetical protein